MQCLGEQSVPCLDDISARVLASTEIYQGNVGIVGLVFTSGTREGSSALSRKTGGEKEDTETGRGNMM